MVSRHEVVLFSRVDLRTLIVANQHSSEIAEDGRAIEIHRSASIKALSLDEFAVEQFVSRAHRFGKFAAVRDANEYSVVFGL